MPFLPNSARIEGIPTDIRACKEITCSMNFKKQRPDSPFFFEKEQVISLRRLRMITSHSQYHGDSRSVNIAPGFSRCPVPPRPALPMEMARWRVPEHPAHGQ